MDGNFPRWAAVEYGDDPELKKYAYVIHVANFDEIGVFLDQIEPLLTLLNGYVDDLESISTTINGNVDQLETITTAISNAATSINNNVDTLESLTATVRDHLKPPSGIGDGFKNVVAAATAEALATTTPIRKVIITAKDTNTGTIVVGGSTVVALAGATRRGSPLLASESVTLEIDDLAKVFIDSTVSGEGVTYTYVSA